MSIQRGDELRPDGTPLGENEESFVLNALLPADTDLSGAWAVTLFRLPKPEVTEQKVLDNLLVNTTQTTDAAQQPLIHVGLSQWQVLDVRRFDSDHPLPSSFGHTWRVGGTALLLATQVLGVTSPLLVSVESVKDATGAEVKGRHNEARLVGLGKSVGDGATYLFYRVILAPPTEFQGPFSVNLRVARSNASPLQISLPATLK